MLVSHALAYLTASKDGLGDVEMEDILSLDDEVLNDVFQHWLPPVRRIPPLLIPRLQVCNCLCTVSDYRFSVYMKSSDLSFNCFRQQLKHFYFVNIDTSPSTT